MVIGAADYIIAAADFIISGADYKIIAGEAENMKLAKIVQAGIVCCISVWAGGSLINKKRDVPDSPVHLFFIILIRL